MEGQRRDEWQGLSGRNPTPSANDQTPSRQLAQGSFGNSIPPSSSHQPSTSTGVSLPPASTYFTPSTTSAPNGTLPPFSGLQHSPAASPQMRDQGHSSHTHQAQAQSAPFSLPGIHQPGQPLSSQAAYEREREREREREHEAHERDRSHAERGAETLTTLGDWDPRERQEREQYRPHMHNDTHIHQPVPEYEAGATPMHRPNGILAGANGLQGNPPPSQTAQQSPETPLNQGQNSLFGSVYGEAARNAVHSAQPGSAGGYVTVPPQQQQPILNDALTYLDQVKVTFQGQADIYNKFLDIMKDFKSQAINTPGVISRVSELFAGNSSLIQGFNTFLPPGYRIECGPEGNPDEITVYGPEGIINGLIVDPQYSPNTRQQDPRFQPGRMTPPSNRAQREQQTSQMDAAIAQHEQEGRGVTQLQNAASVADQGQMAPQPGVSPFMHAQIPMQNGLAMVQQQGLGGPARGPVEFNHAISYVNKIKNRFTGQPDIYKQFLEILQTYQRESRPIQDVYSQVTSLFAEAPDLLRDFKQFLPESAAHAKAESARQAAEETIMTSNLRGTAIEHMDRQGRHTPKPEQQRHLPPIGNFHPTPTAQRESNKRKRGDRTAPIPPPDFGSSGMRSGYGPSKRTKQIAPPQSITKPQVLVELPAVEPTLIPALPQPMPPSTSTAPTAEEMGFFEKVKKHIGNRTTMGEFLKLCNLFSQDLIEKTVLVERARNFIGESPELFNWFKDFVKYEPGKNEIEIRFKPDYGRTSLNNCRAYGPSYRMLPKRERFSPCGGRDDLCKSVLNDAWASHPTWASEDSGFIAHRKNIHEEGLHRIEEERHDYDHHIAVCERAIQVLEPVAQQIVNTPPEDQAKMKLPVDFNNQNHFIFRRVLTKIYGREKANSIMMNMPEKPASIVPIMLLRIRHKMEEWKLSQREWEKVWREQIQKMFWRSLDHQGHTALYTDKRQFQSKTLQNEIAVRFMDDRASRERNPLTPPYQYDWSFADKDVIKDACFLLLTYCEHHYPSEAARLMTIIKDVIPLFFDLDVESFNQKMQEVYDGATPNDDMEDDAPASDGSSQAPLRKNNGNGKGGLLRDVLSKGSRVGRADKEGSVASESRASTPDVTPTAEEDAQDPEEDAIEEVKNKTWFTHPLDGNMKEKKNIKPNEPFKRNVYNLYANLPIYCFFRVFCILYERLGNLKNNEKEVHEKVRRDQWMKPAIEFGIVDRLPSNWFEDTSSTANYYGQVMMRLEDVAKGEGDMANLQELLRRYYLKSGWLMYSFEKMISALARFGIALYTNDPKERNHDIMTLFMKDRQKELTTHLNEVIYRRHVEKYVKDADIYRIAYVSPSSIMRVRLMKREENTFDVGPAYTHLDGLSTEEDRWRHYITLYSSVEPTEGVDQSKVANTAWKPALAETTQQAETIAVAMAGKGKENANEDDADVAMEPEAAQLSAEQVREQLLVKDNQLEFRISPTRYSLHWQQHEHSKALQVESWLHKKDTKGFKKRTAAAADTSVEGEAEHHEDEKAAGFNEKMIWNNSWMAGLSRDAVEEMNREFCAFKGEEIGDVEMAG